MLGTVIALGGLAAAPSAQAGAAPAQDLLDCRFSGAQVFDVQWNLSGTLGVDRMLNVSGAALPYKSVPSAGQLQDGDIAASDYFAFVDSTTNAGSYSLRQFDQNNQEVRVLHDTGVFKAVGPNGMMYLGDGSFGTFFATNAALAQGGGGAYAVDDEDLTDNEALGFDSCSTSPLALVSPLGYDAVTPTRLLDTRDGTALAPMVERALVVTGAHGVPADAGAVNVNVTVTSPAADGWVAAYPCGTERTNSTVNFASGQTAANMALVKVGTGGAICFVSTVDAQLVIDLNGYVAPTTQNEFSPGTPTRLLDTRETATRVLAGQPVAVAIPDQFGLLSLDGELQAAVATTPVAALLNVTATNPAAAGYLTVFPCGTAVPWASNVNFVAGETAANAAVGQLGTNTSVCVVSSTDTDVVVDVLGVFRPNGGTRILTRDPVRVADTRTTQALAAGATLEIPVTDAVAANATGALINLTVTGATGAGYVTVYQCGSSVPWASTLNFVADETAANFAVGSIAGGKLCVYTTTAAHVIVDVNASLLSTVT